MLAICRHLDAPLLVTNAETIERGSVDLHSVGARLVRHTYILLDGFMPDVNDLAVEQ